MTRSSSWAVSWSEGTSELHEETKTKAMEKHLLARPQPRPHQRGARRCAIRDCAVTFNEASPMVRHILEGHCSAGVEDPSCLVQFLRELARLLRLPQKGKNDERELDDLRAFVQRSFQPVNCGSRRSAWIWRMPWQSAWDQSPCLPLMWKELGGD